MILIVIVTQIIFAIHYLYFFTIDKEYQRLLEEIEINELIANEE